MYSLISTLRVYIYTLELTQNPSRLRQLHDLMLKKIPKTRLDSDSDSYDPYKSRTLLDKESLTMKPIMKPIDPPTPRSIISESIGSAIPLYLLIEFPPSPDMLQPIRSFPSFLSPAIASTDLTRSDPFQTDTDRLSKIGVNTCPPVSG